MDLFAVILVSITATTICGICLFIFVCAFQPKFLRKLHGKNSRIQQDTDSTLSSNDSADDGSIKTIDLAAESTENVKESSSRDRSAYLKSLERSLRTGRRIQDEADDENNNDSEPQPNRFNFIRRFINKHIRQRASVSGEQADV